MRRTLGLLATGVLLLGTAGCGVINNGVTGITVDRAGDLVVTLAWCGRQPDQVIIYHDPKPQGSVKPSEFSLPPDDIVDSSITDAVYLAPKVGEGESSFRINGPDNGWRAQIKPPSLDPTITYYAYGAASDSSASTSKVSFRMEHAEGLSRRPGMVLSHGENGEPNAFVTQAEFEREGKVKSCRN